MSNSDYRELLDTINKTYTKDPLVRSIAIDLLKFRLLRYTICLECLCKDQKAPTNNHLVDKDLHNLFPKKCSYCSKDISICDEIPSWDKASPWDEIPSLEEVQLNYFDVDS